jgi:phage regulator Rha-like protein
MIMAQMSEMRTKNRIKDCIENFREMEDEEGKETIMRKVTLNSTIEEALPFNAKYPSRQASKQGACATFSIARVMIESRMWAVRATVLDSENSSRPHLE